jgi:hypothetical protein
VSWQSAWDLVAHDLGLSLAKALELQQIYVSELLHCERQAQVEELQEQLQQHRQQELQEQLQELAQPQQLAAPAAPTAPSRLLAGHHLEQGRLALLQGQRSNAAHGMGPPLLPGSFTAQRQQAVAAFTHAGSPADVLNDDCLPSIDALLLGYSSGGSVLPSARGRGERSTQRAQQ